MIFLSWQRKGRTRMYSVKCVEQWFFPQAAVLKIGIKAFD
jgi:hypothetical protein